MDPTKTREAVEKARTMFFDDPSQSIDHVASALDRMKRGLPRSELSRIRQEVRMRVSTGGQSPKSPVLAVSSETSRRIQPLIRRHGTPPVAPPPNPSVEVKTVQTTEPFNPPRVVSEPTQPSVTDKDIAPSPSEIQAASPALGQEGAIVSKSTQDERFQWLQDWLLNNVEDASVSKARIAMLKKFGQGNAFGSQTVNTLLKAARDAAGLKPRLSVAAKAAAASRVVNPTKQLTPPPPAKPSGVTPIRKGPPTMEEAVRNIVGIMRSGGIQRVELVGDEVKVIRAQPQEFAFKVT